MHTYDCRNISILLVNAKREENNASVSPPVAMSFLTQRLTVSPLCAKMHNFKSLHLFSRYLAEKFGKTQMSKWKKATSRTSCLLPDGGIKISSQNSK